MSDYGILMQKLLVVELLRKHFFLGGGADYGALIGKRQLFGLYKRPRLLQKSRLLHASEIK